MKFVRKTAKFTWQDYKRNEDISSEIKIKPVVKKIRNYRKKWIQHGEWTETDRQTDCHNYEMSSM
jgi:hypothetical protein